VARVFTVVVAEPGLQRPLLVRTQASDGDAQHTERDGSKAFRRSRLFTLWRKGRRREATTTRSRDPGVTPQQKLVGMAGFEPATPLDSQVKPARAVRDPTPAPSCSPLLRAYADGRFVIVAKDAVARQNGQDEAAA
jgi:hypothetical protein